jgi:hypothetical protein
MALSIASRGNRRAERCKVGFVSQVVGGGIKFWYATKRRADFSKQADFSKFVSSM